MIRHWTLTAATGTALLALGAGLSGAGRASPPVVPTVIDDEVWTAARAVLAARCIECHGGEARKGGLSFATIETLGEGGSRGPVIDRASPGASRLLGAIGYANPDLAMPPSGQLPETEMEALRAWVLAGTPWEEGDQLADPSRHAAIAHEAPKDLDWWAYQPLRDEAYELARDGVVEGAEHPIDALLDRQVDREGLEPSGLAPAEQLLRRASFDITGLPPTPEQVAWFTSAYAEDADAAWGALIERLLASPAYGENWARHWLDQVRYAETNGYERDGKKTNIWRYRDWVIRAFNDDMPYDMFVIEQLAGDELAEFAPELGADDTARIATGYFRLGVWDDEPADPVQARADELADIVDTTGQVFLAMTFGCARCHDHKADPISQADYYALTAFFNNIEGYGGGAFGQHLGGGITEPIADPPASGQMTVAERDAAIEDAKGALEREISSFEGVEPDPGRAIVADARRAPTEWRYVLGDPPEDWFRQAFDDSAWSEGAGGFGSKGMAGAQVGTAWTSDRITLRRDFRLEHAPLGAVLSIHHDEDAEVYINGLHVASLRGYRADYTDIQLSPDAMHALVVGSNTLAITCRNTGGAQYIDAGLRTGWLDEIGGWSARLDADAALKGPAFDRARAIVQSIQRLRAAPVAEPYAALVVTERGTAAPEQHVLLRGSAHAEGDLVTARAPTALAWAGEPDLPTPSQGASSTGRRLALAQWLVGPARDVTARVMANRVWQLHFGRGLCRTSGDFGRLGEAPTNPELLDYLAAYLIERDWSLKDLHRHIMSSRLYRTSSVPTDEALARDPRNDLYARTDPRRLTGEQYRDAVLAVSGLSNDAMYGPSVYPPLPAEVLATASRPEQAWGKSGPGDAGRRSIYVHVKRSLREPLLENLDQPDPDHSCPVRFPTNVPTQLLITLNGEFTNDAAAAFAERLSGETASRDEAVRLGILLALGREATDDEAARGVAFLDRLGEEHGLDDGEALRVFCLMLFNLNEFMWVD